jgi:hypothetical protein
MMKFLCLAYGAEKDWMKLSEEERNDLLAQDEVIRSKGNLLSPLESRVITLRAWNGTPVLAEEPFARSAVPLAGVAIIEARTVHEVVALIANTPCARAKGAIEIRRLAE